MVDDLRRRAVDDLARLVAGDRSELAREAHADLRRRARQAGPRRSWRRRSRRRSSSSCGRRRRGRGSRRRNWRRPRAPSGFGASSDRRRRTPGRPFRRRRARPTETRAAKAPVGGGDGVEAAPDASGAATPCQRSAGGAAGAEPTGRLQADATAGRRARRPAQGRDEPARPLAVVARSEHGAQLPGDEQRHQREDDGRKIDVRHRVSVLVKPWLVGARARPNI